MTWKILQPLLQALGAVGAIALFLAGGLASLGTYRRRQFEDLKAVADMNAFRVTTLEGEMATAKTRHDNDVALLQARLGANEALLAALQREREDVLKINLKLQRQLDWAERKSLQEKENGES